MKAYIFEVRDSDGNNCSVFDAVVSAETAEQAADRLWKHLEECYPDDESDGGFGTFHACDCHCEHSPSLAGSAFICEACADSWECSHGGLLVDETPAEYPTVDAAMAERARYHGLIDLTA